ncbi:MAG TPA: 50S ribosomal protein L25 [Candidatus Limnocylindria bacterium]|nr:50S ribosomal protein L25 [Candidatus Limnocylindria bacterium]
MSRPKLSAKPRQAQGRDAKKLRREGILPAVVYGKTRESEAIQLDAHEFELLRRRVGRNALLDLQLDGGRPQPVMLHGIQEHPVTRRTLHVDLLAVNMTEERTVDVPLVMTGTSEAVERLGGVLLHLRDSVQVRALPDDLPPNLELDITPLETFEVVLHASDLVMPAGVTLVTDGHEAIARVQPPRIEEAPEPTAEEEAEEGAEAPEGEAATEAGEGAEASVGEAREGSGEDS